MAILRSTGLICVVLSFTTLHAQHAADLPPAGIVAGTILCADTQKPARFASVTLMPVPGDKPAAKSMTQKEMEADPAAAMKQVTAQMASITMLQGQTGLDGSYSITNVPPGDYYLTATAPGYVSSLAAAKAAAPMGVTGKKLYAGVPVFHVEANRTVRGDVAIDRGAAVFGTVAFDDGSPAGKVIVTIEKIEPQKSNPDDEDISNTFAAMFAGATASAGIADDRGRFRIAGIAPGDYRVKINLQVAASFSMRAGQIDTAALMKSSPLLIYAPGTLHKSEAAKITLGAGEERGDVNIVANLTGMHTVSGRIASAVDHHALNAGSVELTDTVDKELKRTASVDATGAFAVTYVPAGTYTLEVSGGADTEPGKKKDGAFSMFGSTHTLKSYDSASQPVIVETSDVTNLSVELKESKTTKKDFDMNDLMKN